MSIIIMLKASSFSPNSACRSPIVSQFLEVSETAGCQPLAAMKTTARTKLVTTALMEMRLLVVLQRNVNSVMTAVASSGRNKISQGKISYFISGNIQHSTLNSQHSMPPRAENPALEGEG